MIMSGLTNIPTSRYTATTKKHHIFFLLVRLLFCISTHLDITRNNTFGKVCVGQCILVYVMLGNKKTIYVSVHSNKKHHIFFLLVRFLFCISTHLDITRNNTFNFGKVCVGQFILVLCHVKQQENDFCCDMFDTY